MSILDQWKQTLRNFAVNWQKPIPFPTKLKMLIRNETIKVLKRQTCCGHHGEPGC